MKTAIINCDIKVDFKDDYDYQWVEGLKHYLDNAVYLYAKDYTGYLRLSDRNPNKCCLWNDLLYLPDVTEVKVKEIKEVN